MPSSLPPQTSSATGQTMGATKSSLFNSTMSLCWSRLVTGSCLVRTARPILSRCKNKSVSWYLCF